MKALITVGCTTDHGGYIILGDSSFIVEGKAVHLDGMTHYCPRCQIQSKAIASNQGFMTVGGKSIVAAGDLSTCGSRYIKISDLAVMASGSSSGSSKFSSKNTANSVYIPQLQYGQRFFLKDELTEEPLVNMCYEIITKNGVIHGKTDMNGLTEFATGDSDEEVEIRIIMNEKHDHE
ncbi:PAAR domain-containing protein [Acinetobacter piscicola]|nr:PAAR domain-containing protein [Acinetobacter piscicola]